MKIDTDVLEQFNNQLNALVNDVEETWYLIKYLLNEMDIEVLYNNYDVDTELRSAYRKLEDLVERFDKMKQITKSLPYDYEDMIKTHHDEMSMMGEYALGLKHTFLSLSDIHHKERADMLHTNTSSIKYILETLYDIEGVDKDE